MEKDKNTYYEARKKLFQDIERLAQLARDIEEVVRRIKKALAQAEKYKDKSTQSS